MPILGMDHFTILTTNAAETVAFYEDILGLTPGPRPAFSFPGAWLYSDGKAMLHVVEKAAIPEGGGVQRISVENQILRVAEEAIVSTTFMKRPVKLPERSIEGPFFSADLQ